MRNGLVRVALAHRGVITVALLALLVLNLTVIGRIDPPETPDEHLPFAARCQGGGPGCAEQPLIPPPAGGIGLPRVEPVPAPALTLMRLEPAPQATLIDLPTSTLEPPPEPSEHI
jgi:hypothetical protein